LSVNQLTASIIGLALLLWLHRDVHAVLVFDEMQTGAQLAVNADVTFPTDQPTLSGSSLDFINSADAQVLLRWNLLPAAARGPLEITVTVDYDPLTNDNDPIFAITAGTRVLGLFRSDNGSGQAHVVAGSVTTTSSSMGQGDTIVANGLGVVDAFTFNLSSDQLAVTSYEEGAISTMGTFTHPTAMFDPTQSIALVLASSGVSVNERYLINSLTVTISAIPEISPITGVGMAGLLVLAATKCVTIYRRRISCEKSSRPA
jgi:hypothetical protein